MKGEAMSIRFSSNAHEEAYHGIIEKMKKGDCYHQALAYLITLDTVCRQHVDDLFDFDQDIILFDGLKQGWQTGTSRKTTLLAFNLWSTYVDDDAKCSTPSELFCCSCAPYYYEAIKLRYPEYTNE